MRNYIIEAETDPKIASKGNFIKNMYSTERGYGTYYYQGKEHLCIYQRIADSKIKWRIAASVPVIESPLADERKDLMLSSLCFMTLGIILAVFSQGLVVKPFVKIEQQNKEWRNLM